MEFSVPVCKILLLGDGSTGKTRYYNCFNSRDSVPAYCSLPFSTNYLKFVTTAGPIVFNLWDTMGKEKIGGLRDGYYIQSKGAIIFFDISNRATYKNLPYWRRDVLRVNENIPICIVGNKCDKKDRKLYPKRLLYPSKVNVPYFEVSAINNHHIFEPFLYFARTFFSDPSLQILEYPDITPAENTMDPDYANLMQWAVDITRSQYLERVKDEHDDDYEF